jgi:hypothetical protein
MKQNIDTVERLVRASLGLGFLGWILLDNGDLRWLGLLGALPLATALLGYCPLYGLLRINKSENTRR